MSDSNPHQVSSRDFIKGTTAVIGGLIGILGDVISGPPPRPLDEFITKIEGGELFVQLPPIKRESSSIEK